MTTHETDSIAFSAQDAKKHIDDPDVQAKAEEAANAACKVLDEMFPGFDNGGITSNFNGHLKKVLLKMLTGYAVPYRNSLSATHLPELVLTDAAFGNPHVRGDMFLVIKEDGQDWAEIDGKMVPTQRYKALSWDGSAFVQLTDGDALDPSTSYEAAVKEALEWLRRTGVSHAEAKLRIAPVGFAEKSGYVLNAC